MDRKVFHNNRGGCLIRYYYTEKQYKELVDSMVIQIDKREKNNKHITSYFDDKGIVYKSKSFESGDYGFIIPANMELGFVKDTYFSDSLFIERKHDLDELAQNLKNSAFINEIKRVKNIKYKFIVIEHGSWDDILEHKYRSRYNPLAFYRTLLKLQIKHDIHVLFTRNTGETIFNICKAVLDIHVK